jgi:hypothetical protein
MVAKQIHSTYRLSDKKCMDPLKNSWIKVKREYNGDFVVMGYEEPTREFEGKTNLEDWQYWEDESGKKYIGSHYYGHIDAKHISGGKFEPVTKNYAMGWIGGIIYGDYVDGVLTKVGVLSSSCFNEQMRAEISVNRIEFLGKVMELDAMSRHPQDKTIRHATFVQWRDDKTPEECQYENQKG